MQPILTRTAAFLIMFALFSPQSSPAAAEQRTALVIGNSGYSSSPLRNPANDAGDMAETLKNIGFHVILKTNASKRDMGRAIEDFGKRLKGKDVGLFYYAGHGIQLNGVNYLIPVGARISEETDVEYEAVDAGRILAAMHNAGSRVNIVILDACRDNPYARSFRSATRGLAIIARAPVGTIISYSTSPGDVALDGRGRNSPYTSFLMQYMKEPGLSIEQVFKNVRQKLIKETSGKQVPWELSSLRGDFHFTKGPTKTVEPAREEIILSVEGSWNSNVGYRYNITQNGNTFTWNVTSPIREQGRGTISDNAVNASWNGANGPGSASGRITATDSSNRANRIEWSNGVVFFR